MYPCPIHTGPPKFFELFPYSMPLLMMHPLSGANLSKRNADWAMVPADESLHMEMFIKHSGAALLLPVGDMKALGSQQVDMGLGLLEGPWQEELAGADGKVLAVSVTDGRDSRSETLKQSTSPRMMKLARLSTRLSSDMKGSASFPQRGTKCLVLA
ncbi:hypothetical protein H8959_018169 [Pygathrix nigripes]